MNMHIFIVEPHAPIYGSQYHVCAASFDEAERMVLSAEKRNGGDCNGIHRITRVSTFTPEDPRESLYLGFWRPARAAE